MKYFNQLINNNKYLNNNYPKIFGIGLNKTGTTSLKTAMGKFGYRCGDQRKSENLFKDWKKRHFKEIIKYCKSAQFFQDIPFSLDYTYIVLDHAFPKSKFILTIRDNEEQWYDSVVNFHSKKWGLNGRLPTKEDLKASKYINKSWPWDVINTTFQAPESDPYNKDILINYYQKRNHDVQQYFKFRPQDLLVLNIAKKNSHNLLCDFLGLERFEMQFPWVNKTNP